MAPAALPPDAAPLAAQDAWRAAALLAIDPAFAGGIVVRAAAGPVRVQWLDELRSMMAEGSAWRAVPLHVDDDRLLGGIDLGATLRRGQAVAQRGLLSEADGGVLQLAMAERVGASTVAHVSAALDSHVAVCARHGIETRSAARFGVVALDEGADDDEAVSESLRDRLAFCIDLNVVAPRHLAGALPRFSRSAIDDARRRLAFVGIDDAMVETMCAAALALGIDSIRSSLQAVQVARLSAALAARTSVDVDDAALAARLVLAPRATRLPLPPDAGEPESDEVAPPSPEDENRSPATEDEERTQADEGTSLDDVVLTAAAAAIPAGLLARLRASGASTRTPSSSGGAGAAQASRRRGRPIGVVRGLPRGGARLDVLATLRAAVPWQRLRGRDPAAAGFDRAAPLRVRTSDFHVGRFQQRRLTTTIFAVDASGSAALHRLAEAKGAVELLLAECYVRRDSVAVLGFRGKTSMLLLPPTRSLVRAKRSLAELPGGGGTPLAAGVDAARELALAVQRRGDTAVIVVLSDGRANVARDGNGGRSRAEADAKEAAIALRHAGLTTLFIDTSPQPHPQARQLAADMGARYLPLPHAEAESLSRAVRQAQPAR